jgi:putative intracellular protease/amidase
MSATLDVTTTRPKRVLMVLANPSIATTVGWPVGFWGSELTHPWHAFTEVGYEVQLASPDGGRVVLDALSDPRDPSGYSADDLITMGFLHTPRLMALLDDTRPLAACRVDDYDAIVVAGGQAPMFTFPQATHLHALLRAFYEAEKPTAALCHGTCALLHVRLSDGTPLLRERTLTGFANVEEDYVDALVKAKVMPFRIEDEARALGANFVTAGLFKPFAVRDGRLITGQQQFSGGATARLVIQALGI